MIEGIPKISVIVICYKQEELIKRAINSLLAQKDYIYEICVSDDCSPDRTWEVLQEYDKQYPGLFKLHQNRPNVGIFENIEYTWTMPTGDIIYRLAGDDECGEGWFKTVIEYIQNNHIDYKNELFCIYGDYKCVYPNGDSFRYSQRYAKKNKDLVRLYERGFICNRSSCYSVNVLKKFIKVSRGRSFMVENAMDLQVHLFSKRAYYIHWVGNIYYARVGVSANMSYERIQEHEKTMVYAFDFLRSVSYNIHKNDIYLPDYNISQKKFRNHKTLKNLYNLIWCYIRVIDIDFLFNKNVFNMILFGILRKSKFMHNIRWE